MTPLLPHDPMLRIAGWFPVPELVHEGRTVYQNFRQPPVTYALSAHGWDLEVISQWQFEQIYQECQAACQQSSPDAAGGALHKHLESAAAILRSMSGSLPEGL